MRQSAIKAARALQIPIHERGTVVVIQGPRFSTRSESKAFSHNGWEVINMTQYPEGWLARELGICYVNIALITDYDVGLTGHPEVKPVTHQEVLQVFRENNEKLRGLLFELVKTLPVQTECSCQNVADGH
jgi:5'-methylthioadenosine phosphorylase